jgi:hypothetical protein
VSAILVTVLLAVVAVGCALAARPESMRPAVQVALVAAPVRVLGTGAAVAWLRGAGAIAGTDLSYAPLAAGLGPLFVGYVTAVARSPRPCWGSDTVTIRASSTLGLLLMALPVLLAQAVAGIALGTPLMKLAGYGPPPDGTPYLPGAVALGLLLAGITAARVGRRAAAEPSPASPPAPAATVR